MLVLTYYSYNYIIYIATTYIIIIYVIRLYLNFKCELFKNGHLEIIILALLFKNYGCYFVESHFVHNLFL